VIIGKPCGKYTEELEESTIAFKTEKKRMKKQKAKELIKL
jgi:hypothetical protein